MWEMVALEEQPRKHSRLFITPYNLRLGDMMILVLSLLLSIQTLIRK